MLDECVISVLDIEFGARLCALMLSASAPFIPIDLLGPFEVTLLVDIGGYWLALLVRMAIPDSGGPIAPCWVELGAVDRAVLGWRLVTLVLLISREPLLPGLVVDVGIERTPLCGLVSVVFILRGSPMGLSTIMLPVTSGSLLASVYCSGALSVPAFAMLWCRSSKFTDGRKS